MKTAGAGALSLAISTALEFSGLGGPIPTLIAATTAVALAIYLLRTRGSEDAQVGVASGLGDRCQRLGNELVVFARRRESENAGWPAQRAHETDTSSLYATRFASEVVALLRDLVREGCLGAEEANAWVVPDDVHAIERLGRRLLQLGLAAD
jgi:hypothetical protein